MLTFQELICSTPFIYSDIIGGWGGKEKSFIEIETDWTNLDKPSLIMISNEPHHVLQLVEYLSIPHIQGILLYGPEEIRLPQAVINQIEQLNKPVLALKREISPSSLKKTMIDVFQLKSMGLLHYVFEQSTNYWLQFIHEHNLDTVLNRLSYLVGQEILLLDEHFSLHPLSNGKKEATQLKQIATIYYQQVSQQKNTFSIIDVGQNHYLLFPLGSGKRKYGFILLQAQAEMLTDICTEQIIHALPAFISHFKKEDAAIQAHQSYKEDFLYKLLYNHLESEQQLLRQGKQWGWDFTKPIELMVLRINQKHENMRITIGTEAIMGKIRSIMAARFLQTIPFSLQGDIVILIFNTENQLPKERKELALLLAVQIHKMLEEFQPDLECELGIGRHYASNMELFRSFYEAKVAIELGKYEMKNKAVQHFEDIGIARLLSNIHRHNLHDYYAEVLKELLSDQENSQMYIETLEAFYHQHTDINRTAEQLFVHPNTLRKRIKKIEATLHIDFNQLDDLLKVYVAIIIMKMLR